MTDPGTLALFAMTPGDLLEKYLKDKGIEKAEFGRMIGADYQKAHRWTQNEGFNPKNRRRAEQVLGLPSGYFDRPDADDASRERELHRRRVFARFLETDIAKRLDPSIVASLDQAVIPPGRRATVDFFTGLSLVYAGQLTEKEALDNLDWNERESREIVTKTTPKP